VTHAGSLRLRYAKLRETFATHAGRLGLNPKTTAPSIGSSVIGVYGLVDVTGTAGLRNQ